MKQAHSLHNKLSIYPVITLGGGCFWCTEAVFDRVKGVVDVESGYCNGHVQNPTYEQVCDGNTGHVEVVQLRYDPKVISLRELLEIFFVIHDPTTLNRQGNDVGTQYRSGIYLSDAADRDVTQSVYEQVNKAMQGKVVTEIEMLHNYSAAEDYHRIILRTIPIKGIALLWWRLKSKSFCKLLQTKFGLERA